MISNDPIIGDSARKFDDNGLTELHKAAAMGQVHLVALFYLNGMDVSIIRGNICQIYPP